MTDLRIFDPSKVRGIVEGLEAERDALAKSLAAAREVLRQVQFEDNETDALTSYVRGLVDAALPAPEKQP